MATLHSYWLSIEVKHLLSTNDNYGYPAFDIHYHLQFSFGGIQLFNPLALRCWHGCPGVMEFSEHWDNCSMIYWLNQILAGKTDLNFRVIEPPFIAFQLLKAKDPETNNKLEPYVLEHMRPEKRKSLSALIVPNEHWHADEYWLRILLDNTFFEKTPAYEDGWGSTLVFYLPVNLQIIKKFRDDLQKEWEEMEAHMAAQIRQYELQGDEPPAWAKHCRDYNDRDGEYSEAY